MPQLNTADIRSMQAGELCQVLLRHIHRKPCAPNVAAENLLQLHCNQTIFMWPISLQTISHILRLYPDPAWVTTISGSTPCVRIFIRMFLMYVSRVRGATDPSSIRSASRLTTAPRAARRRLITADSLALNALISSSVITQTLVPHGQNFSLLSASRGGPAQFLQHQSVAFSQRSSALKSSCDRHLIGVIEVSPDW
jgi:hypothetical protein